MPYSQGTRLPGESASKLGHLAVIQSEWVRSLVQEFDHSKPPDSDPSAKPEAILCKTVIAEKMVG